MTNEELNTELYKKLFAEQEKFKGWLLTQPPSEILNHAYEYVMREDIVLALEYHDLSDERAKALLASRPRERPWEEPSRVRLKGELPNALKLPDGCRFWPRCLEYQAGLCDKCEPEWKDQGNGHRAACSLVGT